MSLFQYGDFKLNSGATSKWKLECDALTQGDLKALAFMAFQILPPFGLVVGVPTGGLLFAECLRAYTSHGPTLIVDDVLTTGGSIEREKSKANKANGDPLGVVIFARGKCPPWVQALFQMPEKLWIKEKP